MLRHFLAALCVFAVMAVAAASAGEAPAELAKADELFKKQNWMEARTEYDKAMAQHWQDDLGREIIQKTVDCCLQLSLWDDALDRASQYLAKNKDGFNAGYGSVLLGSLYQRIPHYGTKQGGKFLRGQRVQGVYVSSQKKDRRVAIAHYEAARDFYATPGLKAPQGASLESIRISVNNSLADVLFARPGYYGGWQWDWWWGGWGWRDSEDDSEDDTSALDDADYEEPRQYRWAPPAEPRGLPVDRQGNPRFIVPTKTYDTKLSDAEKIRFLLDEIIALDTTPAKNSAARALLRRAMIARSLYGPESVRQYTQQRVRYDQAGRPIPSDPAEDPMMSIWELKRNEALCWVGGQVKRISLPADEDPLALIDRVTREYPKAGVALEARYAAGLYLQMRQQFPEAIVEYRKVLGLPDNANRPKDQPFAEAIEDLKAIVERGDAWFKEAAEQIRKLSEPEVALQQTNIALPGTKAPVNYSFRNTSRITFRAFEFDMQKMVLDGMRTEDGNNFWQRRNVFSPWRAWDRNREFQPYKPYVGKMLLEWAEDVPDDGSHRPADRAATAQLEACGAYLIEAEVAGGNTARCLLLITDIAILHKNMPGKGVLFLADALTGQPVPQQKMTVFEHRVNYANNQQTHEFIESEQITNDQGIIEYKHQKWGDVDAVAFLPDNRMAFTFLNNWSTGDATRDQMSGPRIYVVTDRPVYRPMQEVNFKVWLRNLRDGAYTTARQDNAHIEIYDPKGTCVRTVDCKLDDFGGADGAFSLSAEPPLGVWRIRVNGNWPDARQNAGGLFRVEEYKKPEFEVSVKPDATQTRLGGKIRAKVEARYYFGNPVVNAQVTYKVFREDYRHYYAGPGEYDWLYGRGYGRCYYAYPWFRWWGKWGYDWHCAAPYRYRATFPWGSYGDDAEASYRRRLEGSPRKALRELVATGIAGTGKDGTFDIEIDTARAVAEHPGTDSRYTIEVDVRDASRRTISGEGSVIASRQAFYAFLDADRGWYSQGKEAFVELRCLTADNVPVAATGELTAFSVAYGDAGQVRETKLDARPAQTDAEGRFSTKYNFTVPGQYRIAFATKDAWGSNVQANVLVWVGGPNFDGRQFRFNDLEVITDKRTYDVGDVARIMINTATTETMVLLGLDCANGQMRSYQMVEVPGRSKVIEVPIEQRHSPNFFIEASTIHNGRAFHEMREMLVPPKHGLLSVQLSTDKAEYKPGEKGKVRVSVRDAAGKPAAAQLALAGYDKAVNYIQPEFGPSMQTFFWGQKRYHWPTRDVTLDQVFGPDRAITRMEWNIGRAPSDWYGWSGELRYGLGRAGGVRGMAKGNRFMAEREVFDDAAPMAAMKMEAGADKLGDGNAAGQGGGGPEPVEAAVRMQFADTAIWLPALNVGPEGEAETEVTFPDNLTTWRIRGYAISQATAVADTETQAVTTKKFIVRLQAPRFFVERDEVVLSANIHNYLKTDKKAKVSLELSGGTLEALGEVTASVTVKAGAEARVDFPVKVLRDGMARISVKALTDEESDAVSMAFPALVHGIDKTLASSGAYRADAAGTREIDLPLPEEINPEATTLEVTLSPSLAGAMIDALPYLAGYPYGCVEQTLSRFVPCVLVAKTLRDTGMDLETIGRKRLEGLNRREDVAHRFQRHDVDPVFDSAELDRMTRAGLDRLMSFQKGDGGWGWWKEDESSPYTSAYAVWSLKLAQDAGVAVDNAAYQRGVQFLMTRVDKELKKDEGDWWRYGGIHTQAHIAYVLSMEDKADREWLKKILERRAELTLYSKSLLAMALNRMGLKDESALVLQNVLQFVEQDDENDTAWVRAAEQGWWYWWNNSIETNGYVLMALSEIQPKSEIAPRLVKWLLNNRRNGSYWSSTRDTAQVIAAMISYMKASGEGSPDYTLVVTLDGKTELLRERVTKDNMFSFNNRITLDASKLPPGPHKISVNKEGAGALYYSTYLSFFTKEENIKGAGNEVFVKRTYYKLTPVAQKVTRGQGEAAHSEDRLTFDRKVLKNGERVYSGDLIEVVLQLRSKNNYDYLVFEDMKPAGCEPVEVRSGGRWAGGLCANVELRDTKVAFFIAMLEQGEHVLKYRLRAEIPGTFHVLPAKGWAMYAPEIKTISDEMHLGIRD